MSSRVSKTQNYSQENVRNLIKRFDNASTASVKSISPTSSREILPDGPIKTPVTNNGSTESKTDKSDGSNNQRSKFVQLLYMTEDSFRMDAEVFVTALGKVDNFPVAIISMNGACREGKSFVLNYFLRYFRTLGNPRWFTEELPPQDMFSWRSGQKRETVGINLWSEPFIIPQTSSELAVFLLDCQGLFDDQTTFQQNAMIYALSNLLSSVMIYNVKCKIQENLLQNIQYFSSYAKALSSDENSEEELPHFVFLVRDFEFFNDYQYGYHGKYTFPHLNLDQPRNYYLDTFSTPPGMPAENQTVRQDVLGSYSDVGCFLMPFPGRAFLKDSKKHPPDQDFQEYLQKFIQLFTSSQHLVPKKVGGLEVTGKELKAYVRWWAAECAKSTSKFPGAKSIAESTSLLQNEVAANNAFAIYQQHFQDFFQSPTAGVDDTSLKNFHHELVASVLKYYESSRKLGDASVVKEYLQKIQELCEDAFKGSYFEINAEVRARNIKKLKDNENEEKSNLQRSHGFRTDTSKVIMRENNFKRSNQLRDLDRSLRGSQYFGNIVNQQKLHQDKAHLDKQILVTRVLSSKRKEKTRQKLDKVSDIPMIPKLFRVLLFLSRGQAGHMLNQRARNKLISLFRGHNFNSFGAATEG